MSNFEIMSEDFMINVLQTQKEEKMKVQALEIVSKDHERRLTEIEFNTPINATLNNYLSKLRRQKIVELMGGKKSNAYLYEYPKGSRYKKLASKVFSEAARAFNSYFKIANYGELRQHQYEEAVKFWNEYELGETAGEVFELNHQVQLFRVAN